MTAAAETRRRRRLHDLPDQKGFLRGLFTYFWVRHITVHGIIMIRAQL